MLSQLRPFMAPNRPLLATRAETPRNCVRSVTIIQQEGKEGFSLAKTMTNLDSRVELTKFTRRDGGPMQSVIDS
jgi:hypothetical protein